MKANEKYARQKKINLIYPVFLVLMLIVLAQKTNYHTDEIFTYGLSNHVGSVQMQFETGRRYDPADKPFSEYVTVREGERFRYANVWKNQKNDVHPPLYYALVHTVCSFFPGKFSVWFAGSVNIVFALLTLAAFGRLTLLLTGDGRAAGLISVAFILLSGVLSAASFLRMYGMAMFFVTVLTLWCAEYWEGQGDSERKTRSDSPKESAKAFGLFCGKVCLMTLLGALTHYYCILYAAALFGVFGLFLLGKRQWRQALGLVGGMILTGGLYLLIFPASVEHVLHGQRGVQSFQNLQNRADVSERFRNFYHFLNKQVFGDILLFLTILIVTIAAYLVLFKSSKPKRTKRSGKGNAEKNKKNRTNTQANTREGLSVFLPVLLPEAFYFFFVAKSAAYQTDRYIMPIYAVCFTGVMSLLYRLMQKLSERKGFSPKSSRTVLAILLLAAVIGSHRGFAWEYLYRQDAQRQERLREFANADCICIYDGNRWKVQTDIKEYQNYAGIVFFHAKEFDEQMVREYTLTDRVVVSFVGNADRDGTLERIRQAMPQFTRCELLGEFMYSTSYLLEIE